ncbi:cytochrome P450 6k1 [Copidosoma floridanum]|uniref:cytochrome P450 6k1 n=1 Tax=Copidosoma floridanum TaxID=29053 RepID=UPI0006C98D2B|nr:cytochrome P450 6k1 [Copidosoma floridanum]
MPDLYLTLAFATAVFLLFRYYAKYKLSYWKRQGIEELPNTDLVFGNLKDGVLFRTSPGYHVGVLHRSAVNKDAPITGFYIFHKPCLLIRDTEIIKNILIRDFDNFSDRVFSGDLQRESIDMKNLFGLKSAPWKHLRSKVVPTFNISKMKQMLPLIIQTGETMADYLREESVSSNGKMVIDAQEMNYKYASGLIANIALGTPMNMFRASNEFTKFAHKFFHGFKRRVALVALFFIPEVATFIGPKMLVNVSSIKKILRQVLQEREESGQRRGDFIDSLIEMKNGEQNPIHRLEGENLLDVTGTFFSGFESSSLSITFTLFELAGKPEYQEKARQEIEKAIEEYGMTYEAFNHMKYVDQCLNEGLRLHPPISTIDRVARNDYKIPGTNHIIKKGTAIYISLYGMQTDPRFFDQPDVFDPSRFDGTKQISDAYMPFGIGPRMCLGVKSGELHSKVALAIILRDYIVMRNPKEELILDPKYTFTGGVDGMKLYFEKIVK